jgi:hypothetical protein
MYIGTYFGGVLFKVETCYFAEIGICKKNWKQELNGDLSVDVIWKWADGLSEFLHQMTIRAHIQTAYLIFSFNDHCPFLR